MQSFRINQIGVVQNEFDEDNAPEDWSNSISEIRIYSRYEKGLFRLNQADTRCFYYPQPIEAEQDRGIGSGTA